MRGERELRCGTRLRRDLPLESSSLPETQFTIRCRFDPILSPSPIGNASVRVTY